MPDPRGTERIDVQYVADLARIDLTSEEAERYAEELVAVVEYARQLQEVQVENIEPTAHAIPRVNVLRDDNLSGDSLSREKVLQNAPAVIDDVLVRVPAVIGDSGES